MKVRDFSIDLADLERTVSRTAAVSEVSVTLRKGRRAGLVVNVLPEPGGPPIDVMALRTELAGRVPREVPTGIVVRQAMPDTGRGDVDASPPPAPSSCASLPTAMVGPRDDVEAVIISALESVLEISPIGVHDDFFALGADSLAVVEARTLIERRLGREISMAALMDGSTAAELARILREDRDEGLGSSLVPLRTSGTRPPLFLVHGGGGNVLMWRALTARLSPDQPVYGIQITETPPRFLKSVNRMAGYYLRQVREVQPNGPYLFGGFSAGGAVAMEMASQLAAVNEQPALVVNFDGLAPKAVRESGGHLARQLRRLIELDVAWLAWRLRWAYWRLSLITRTQPAPSPWHDPKASKRYSIRIMGRALARHRPRRYDGRVLQLRTNRTRWAELGWERHVTSLDTITIPGEHTTILQPPLVDIVVAHLDGAITSALGLSQPPTPELTALGTPGKT